MPYLNGDRTVDASGNGLLDAAANALQTPPFDFSQIVAGVNALYQWIGANGQNIVTLIDQIAGSTPFVPLSWGWALARLADQWINGPLPWEDVGGAVLNPTFGLEALNNQLAAIYASANYTNSVSTRNIQQVLDALAGGVDVTGLPTTYPPTWPQAPSTNDIWGHILGFVTGNISADYGLSKAFSLANDYHAFGGLPVRSSPHFIVYRDGNYQTDPNPTIDYPQPSYLDIQADDTVVSWLNRTDASDGGTWLRDPSNGFAYRLANGNEQFGSIYCTLTDADLQAIRAGYGNTAASASNVAPVWPGIANVTLGAPVAISSHVEIDAPMDGVIIALTSVPSGKSTVDYGDVTATLKIAYLIFGNDDGEYEFPQVVAFDAGFYCPKTMVRAAHLRLNALPAVAGTITPWTIAS